jgi:putative SOS response-associated peptidase YedK
MTTFRYSFTLSKNKTARRFGLSVKELPESQYNISHGKEVVTITDLKPDKISLMTLGLMENSEKTAFLPLKTIQRRVIYKQLLSEKRCIIPADGFYIWREVAKKSFVPYRVVMKWNLPFAFAGIWQEKIDEITGEVHNNCSIILTEANELIRESNSLMPAILSAENEKQWLVKEQPLESILKMLYPYPADVMKIFPITTKINDINYNDSQLFEEVRNATDQLGNYMLLFQNK